MTTLADVRTAVEELRANSIAPVNGFYVVGVPFTAAQLEAWERWEAQDEEHKRRRRSPLWWRGEKKRRRRARRLELRVRPLHQDETPPVG